MEETSNLKMTKATTKEELTFALEHGLDFSRHHIAEFLDYETVKEICNELGVKARLEATVHLRSESSSCTFAYYTLSFLKNTKITIPFATYYGEDLVSSDNNYTIEPEEEEQYE